MNADQNDFSSFGRESPDWKGKKVARIAGVNVPDNKRVEISLRYLYGIGPTRATYICEKLGIAPATRMKDLTEDVLNAIRKEIEAEGYVIEGDLRRETQSNIKRLKEINSYRGTRHAKHLPLRGQRTKTNSRTVRGNKRMVAVSGRAKAGLKT